LRKANIAEQEKNKGWLFYHLDELIA